MTKEHNLFNAEILVHNAKTGKLEQHFEAESFVAAFLGMLCAQCAQSLRTVTDEGGTPQSVNSGADQWEIDFDTLNTNGVVLGTGALPVTVDDNKLQTKIADGIGAGQLDYQITAQDTIATQTATEVYYDISRLFINSSGGTITVNEIGLMAQAEPSFFKMLIDRTNQTIVFNDTDQKTITYRLKVTVL